MQSETLKPCPFCGGDAQMRGSSDGEVEWYQCRRCAYESPPHYSQAKAIAAWNNGTPTPPAVSAGLVERLRGEEAPTDNLIAAAPDLLAALIAVRRRGLPDRYTSDAELIAQVDAALLKASPRAGEG